MDSARHQLFTRPTFAVNQDGAGGGCDGANGQLEFFHRRTGADDVVERIVRGSVTSQGKILFAQSEFFQHTADCEPDFVNQARALANVIGRSSRFYRFHGGFVVIDRSDQDYRRIGRNAMGVAKDFDAVDVWHLDVGDDDIIESAINFIFGSLAGLNGFNAVSVAAQGNVEHFADGTFIVADENISHDASLPPQPPPFEEAQRLARETERSFQLCASRSRLVLRRDAAASTRKWFPAQA